VIRSTGRASVSTLNKTSCLVLCVLSIQYSVLNVVLTLINWINSVS